ncbi:MAG: amidohydrolase [Firmicutes bacterium]|nr:amidohydrolase [Bacillota bacterium]
MKLLFKNCDILHRTAPGQYEKLTDAFLAVDGDTISYIGIVRPEGSFDVEKDMSGKLLMAGLVNAHGHSPMTLLLGVGSGLGLQDWLNNAIFPIEARLRPSDIAVGTQLAMLEMLAGGTTCFSEMYDFPFAGAEVIADAGMKANICRVGLCFDPGVDIEKDQRFRECVGLVEVMRGLIDGNEEQRRETSGLFPLVLEAVKDGRIVPEFCLHSEYLTQEPFVRAIAEKARALGAGVNVHVSETKKEHEECIARHGRTPIAYLDSCGILDSRTYAAHCVWCTDEDLDIMAHSGTSLVHNPSSNMKLGSGFARIVEAVKRGVNVAIGTDGCASNNDLDMFEEMRLAALLCSGTARDAAAISAGTVLDMATVNGARALGRKDTGLLEVGKKADVIAINMDAPHLRPDFDTASLIVYCAKASDVYMTMVDGNVLYGDGSFFTLDRDKIIADAEEAVLRLEI